MRLKLLSVCLAALCLLSTQGCGGGQDGSDTNILSTSAVPIEAPPPSTSSPKPTVRLAAVDPEVLSPHFAVFRGPRDDADEVPQGMILGPVISGLGLDLNASRYAREIAGGPAYLVPGSRSICLYTESEAVGSCWQPRIVASGQAIATSLCGPGLDADHVVTFGLVPDGVEEVTVLRTNVPSVTVAVEGNVFVAKTSSEPPLPLRVSWIRGDKRFARSSGIPAEVARRGC